MKRAYAVIMRDYDYKFIGVYTVVDTIEKAEEICTVEHSNAEFEHLTWTPTFYEGE